MNNDLRDIFSFSNINRKKCVLFDIDGTISESRIVLDIFFEATKRVMGNDFNIPAPSLGVVPISEFFLNDYYKIAPQNCTKIIEQYNSLFLSKQNSIFEGAIYEETEEIFEKLFALNVFIGIYTLREYSLANRQISSTILNKYIAKFDDFPNGKAITGTNFIKNHIYKDGFDNKLEQIKFHITVLKKHLVNKDEILIVGDSIETDIEVAKKLEIDYIHINRLK